MLKQQGMEFCINTYGHGFRYLTLKHTCIFERVLWTFITVGSLIGTIAFSLFALNKALQSTTITVTDTPNHPISNFPFPAITICNFNTISKSRAFEVAAKLKTLGNTTLEELAWKIRLLHYLTDSTPPRILEKEFLQLQEILEINNIDSQQLFLDLSPTCKEMLNRCNWKGQHIACENLFQRIETPHGFCCSFNYFAVSNSDKQESALNTLKPSAPRRVSATGYFSALEIVIDSVPEDYFATEIASYGHMIFVHYPYNFPGENSQMLLQYLQGIVLISITPTLYRTDGNVNNLNIEKRNCSFIGERKLKYFVYTYHNCIIDCQASIIVGLCGCIPFYYINNNGSKSDSRICNMRDIFCLSQNKGKIHSLLQVECSCLHNCDYCMYSIEGSAGIFSREFVDQKPSLYGGLTLYNQSVVRVCFDDLVATRFTTSMTYYWHTILGLIGGILGLWIGFSASSAVEIVYFLVIRPIIATLRKYRLIKLYVKTYYK